MNAAARIVTVKSGDSKGIFLLDLMNARATGGRVHAEIDGIAGAWIVRSLITESVHGEWMARLQLATDDDPPRGPLTEPKRRRG